MDVQRWHKIDRIFQDALELAPESRGGFLEQACRGDSSIRAEVEALLVAHQRAGSFIESTALAELSWHTILNKTSEGHESGAGNSPVTDWDRYHIIELIGEGGMGSVYKAQDMRLRRAVALKFIRSGKPEMIERFLREARAQARIEHDNICKVYEVGEVEGHHYIAMQLIYGTTLAAAKHQLSLTEKVKVIKAVAEALQAAHSAGLIHRDVKPDNILLERTSAGLRPYVMDFGLVREIETEGMTVTGAIMGTPAYMSPEQAQEEGRRLDHRSDIYSLGATLYELLAGHPPFGNSLGMGVMIKVLQDEPPRLRKSNIEIPEDLETIVMKCLEKEPSQRYASAQALADDLQAFLDNEPIRATPVTFFKQLRKKARKHRALVAISATALLMIMILGGLSVQARWNAARQTRVAQQFGQEIKEIEAVLRYAYMLPLHDTRSEKAAVRQRMETIERQIAELGSVAIGPGNYALGRGHLALNQYEQARVYLERAWSSPYQTPEVNYALGQTLGALYQKHLEEAQRITNKDLREARRRDIEREYRDPALAYLKASRGLQPGLAAYVEGLIAFYEQRYEEALDKAEQAYAQLNWLYEAKKLSGDIYAMIGTEKQYKGDYAGALADYERAGLAYAQARELARSDSTIYEQACGCRLQIMAVNRERGRALLEDFRQAEAACDQALQANSENWSALHKKSMAYLRYAEYQFTKGEDPAALLAESLKLSRLAIEHNPALSEQYHTAGTAYIVSARYQRSRGEDPRPALDEAAQYLEKALQVMPGLVKAATTYNNLSGVYFIKGQYELDKGRDPRPWLEKAAHYLHKTIELNPKYVYGYSNLGAIYSTRGRYEETCGFDPRPSLEQAAHYLQESIRVNANFPGSYHNLGMIFHTRARYELNNNLSAQASIDRAKEMLEESIKKKPDDAATFNNLAHVFIAQAQEHLRQGADPSAALESAAQALSRARQLNDKSAFTYQIMAVTHRWRAEWRLRKGVSAQAEIAAGRRLLEQSLAINPRLADAIALKGAFYLLEARTTGQRASAERALTLFNEALKLNNLLAREYQPLIDEAKRFNHRDL